MTECRFKNELAAIDAHIEKKYNVHNAWHWMDDASHEELCIEVIEALRAQQAPTLPPDAVERVREALDRGGFHATARMHIEDAIFINDAIALLPEVKKGGIE